MIRTPKKCVFSLWSMDYSPAKFRGDSSTFSPCSLLALAGNNLYFALARSSANKNLIFLVSHFKGVLIDFNLHSKSILRSYLDSGHSITPKTVFLKLFIEFEKKIENTIFAC